MTGRKGIVPGLPELFCIVIRAGQRGRLGFGISATKGTHIKMILEIVNSAEHCAAIRAGDSGKLSGSCSSADLVQLFLGEFRELFILRIFHNGSLLVLTYSARGHHGLPADRHPT